VSVLVLVLQVDLVRVRVSVAVGGVAVLVSVLDMGVSVLGVHVSMDLVLMAVLVRVCARVGVLVSHQDSPFVTRECLQAVACCLGFGCAIMLTCACVHVKLPT
jgi:hypothetical protein